MWKSGQRTSQASGKDTLEPVPRRDDKGVLGWGAGRMGLGSVGA